MRKKPPPDLTGSGPIPNHDALAAIERAVEQRFGSRAAYERDADFAKLREQERFLMALDRLGG